MPRYAYDRLSGQDNDFLLWETPGLPMHVGGTMIFDAGPLQNDHGGIDFETVERLTASLLHRLPRYRQKLEWVPGESHAVWVDDEHFNIHYHFRHTSLPRPGSEEQLKRLTARLMESPLDRSRPLWETWVIEGLEGNRFAVINKIHHCILDGAGGVDLSQILLSTLPKREIEDSPPFLPRPVPGARELRINEWRERASAPLRAAGGILKFVRESPDILSEIGRHARMVGGIAKWKLMPTSDTPINGDIGPHRVVDWIQMPLAELKAVKNMLDCSINDIVLAVVTGAIRQLMQRRQIRPEELDFRVSSPVNVRNDANRDDRGNHVSSWIIRLPIGLANPVDQLMDIRSQTRELKESDLASTLEIINSALDWLSVDLQTAAKGTINMVVSNVPGPPFPLYLLGAELERIIPFPPLLKNVGLMVGVLSYNGGVSWGLIADYDRMPDMIDFAASIRDSFERLAKESGVDLSKVPRASDAGATPRPDSSELESWQHPASEISI